MIVKTNSKTLDLSQPQVMGILNVTPDSFSDGGQFACIDKALTHAFAMIEAGASIIDIGGESTRPNASDVSTNEELNRVIPIIRALRQQTKVWISVDTSKAEVMRQAIAAGADMINDVRALRLAGAMEVAANSDVLICLMHMQGEPKTMQHEPDYHCLLQEVAEFLEERIAACQAHGIAKDRLILDPGFGFGKTLEQNYQLLANLSYFQKFDLPILAGMSRKSMLSRLLNKSAQDCLAASVSSATIAALQGARIIRAHDVSETRDALDVVAMMQSQAKIH